MAILAGGSLVLAALAPAAGAAYRGPEGLTHDDRAALAMGVQAASKSRPPVGGPRGPNPYLSLLPDPSSANYAGWRRHLEAKAAVRADRRAVQQRLAGVVPPMLVEDEELAGGRGGNDRRATAQRLAGFGTLAGLNARARVLGTISPERVFPRRVRSSAENDGSIRRARGTGIPRVRDGIRTSGRVGDGPHGRARSGRGDFDFYRVRVPAGHRVLVDTDTPTGRLDSMVAVFNGAGDVVAFNDDADGLDSRLSFRAAPAGVYYVMVSGFFSVPRNPFRPGSGTGAESQGPYNLRILVGEDDTDLFAVRLRQGDVLGASMAGATRRLTIVDPAGVEVHGSEQDASFIYPAQSPLPGGGRAVTEHVADENGLHYVAVTSGAGRYDITVEAYRPRLEGDPTAQTLFLDFDGARINTGMWGGPGVRTLSPLRAFLGRWSLRNADLDPLIDTIVAEVEENVEADLVASGLDDDVRIEVLNSRDHPDSFGADNVSRIIVGGTIRQSGIPTIGIAQSIDPGNFDTEESALVLLDLLSEPRGPTYSLNTWLRPASDRIGFVGQAVGNVAAHEAGHFFGDWHVDQFNRTPNLMDQGGNFRVLYGVGPDRVGGSADDRDVDFGEDVFNPNEGFTGIEDTLSRLAVTLVG